MKYVFKKKNIIQLNEEAFLVPDYDLHLRILGRLIGKALVEGYETGVDFSKPFLKQILGIFKNKMDKKFSNNFK